MLGPTAIRSWIDCSMKGFHVLEQIQKTQEVIFAITVPKCSSRYPSPN